MIKILNKYNCSDDEKLLAINIMRPSPLGNPYIIGKHGIRGECVKKYKPYLVNEILNKNPKIIEALRQINKDSLLLCCCPEKQQICHGCIIKEVMEEILGYEDFDTGLKEFIEIRSLDKSIKNDTIEIVEESLFHNKDVDAIVNTVNCVGVMGTGVAAEFKARYMENFIVYQQACKAKQIKPGDVFVFDLGEQARPRYIFNLATKDHWKDDSKMEYIECGLRNLNKACVEYRVNSLNMPKIGCGNGGLDWDDVYHLMQTDAYRLPYVKVRVCTLENTRPDNHVQNDGISHINIAYQGKTQLGKYLSNLTRTPFTINEVDGEFQSVEAYWYWLSTGSKYHYLKELWGYSAKQEGKKYPSIIVPNFYDCIKLAFRLKVKQNMPIRNALYFSELPFDHYYTYGNENGSVIRIPPSSEWICQEWELIRQEVKQEGFRLIIAGSRDFMDYDYLKEAYFNLCVEVTEIVSGGARGVDALGERLSLEVLGKPAIVFPADWDKHGKAGGPIRNQQMADYAHGLLAINLNQSPGTTDMIIRAKQKKLKTSVIKVNSF